LAARGDVDRVLVHSPDDEMRFVEAGFGVDRRPVMQNRFVIVGPSDDPVDVGGASMASAAFAAIAGQEALFLSRGDESGTHKAERGLWAEAGIDPLAGGSDGGRPSWYRESGSGQGATLNIAANTNAYTLTDEATWITFGNPGKLRALFTKDDPALRNLYSVIRVNPEQHGTINVEGAMILADWLTSKAGQGSITSFQVMGRTLFEAADPLAG
jgi:tungstate transport system substrate-binding protein